MTLPNKGTSGLMPVKGSGCGIRPDLEELGEDTGFDFSQAHTLLPTEKNSDKASNKDTKKVGK